VVFSDATIAMTDVTVLEVRIFILLSLVVARRHADKWVLGLPW
jgi:hypothetical protein